MKRKRSTVLFFTVLILISALSPAFAVYDDTAGHPAADAIERWSERGVIQGYDGKFRPDDLITRAEMAVIIGRVLKYRDTVPNNFTDLDEGWYTDAVLKANAAEVILGYEGKVRPFDNITRAEAAVMLSRAFGVPENAAGTGVFADAAAIPDWAEGPVGGMASSGALPFDGEFKSKQDITRAEVVNILDALVAEILSEPGAYTLETSGNVLINAANVVLSGAVVGGDLYFVGDCETVILADTAIGGKIRNLSGADLLVEGGEPADDFTDPAEPDIRLIPARDIAELDLTHGSEQTVNVIVRAGRSLSQIFALLEEKGVAAAVDLYSICREIDFSQYFPILGGTYTVPDRVYPLEGYIVPATYTMYLNSSPALVMKTLLDKTTEVYAPYLDRAAQAGMTLDEVITVSSIIEKEVGGCTIHDKKTVASVIYNRLDTNMKLQMNVTRNYITEYVLPFTDDPFITHYEQYYDTYQTSGLPAGAICTPRAVCIGAALEPYDTDYVFFRSDSYGNIYYAVTYDEHIINGVLAENATAYLGYLGNVPIDGTDFDDYTPVNGPYSGYTIMLDAGHGGTDPGADTGNVYEKDIALAVTLKLRDILREYGVNVLMIRDDDTGMTPIDRTAVANERGPDLYLSIHCNSVDGKPSVNGIETFYYPGDTVSAVWAGYVQSALIAATGAVDRGSRSYELIVLHYTEMPSIMAELGFMTNAAELALLQSDSYQDILARALAEGTFAYLDSL